MALLQNEKVKLFTTFLVVYSLFIHWSGWNEQTRLSLTRAVIEEGRLEIDSYANLTGDRILYNSNFYSDKAPGASFLASPLYAFWQLFYFNAFPKTFIVENFGDNLFIKEEVEPRQVYIHNNPGFFILTSMIFTTIFISSLFGTLSVVVFYKILSLFEKDKKRKILLTFIFGIATPLFYYSTVHQGNIVALFLLVLSFYVLLKYKSKSMFLLSGILIGLSVFFDYISVLALASLLLYVTLKKEKKFLPPFFIGSLIGVVPLLTYNFVIFNNPFTFTLEHTVKEISGNLVSPGSIKCAIPPFDLPKEYILTPFGFVSDLNCSMLVFPRLLFFPERGIFFYYPLFLLSFIGIWYMWKSKYKAEAILVLLIFILFSISLSFYGLWWGGSVFGPKYFLLTIPFLTLALVFFLRECRKRILIYLFYLLISLSIFNNFIGLQPPQGWLITLDKDLPPNFFTAETYIQKLQSFEPIVNPLFEHYLPLFLKDSPRSRILEGLSYDPYKIDIRDFKPMPVRELKLFTLQPFGILVLKIPFLVAPILLLILTLIWRRELFKIFVFKKISIGLLLLILIVLLFISRFEFKDIVYDKNWYPIHVNTTHVIEERWMSQEASIFLYSPKEEKANLLLEIGSFHKPRQLRIEVNDKIFEHLVASSSEVFTAYSVPLREGENVIRLRSLSGCDRPASLTNGSNDYRCLSFIVHELFVFSHLPEHRLIFGESWYPPEPYIVWAYENSTIFIKSSQKVKVKLNLTLISYHKPREIDFYFNSFLFDTFRIEPYRMNILTKTLSLREGENIIEFISKEKCDIPAIIEKSNDTRCLSFGLIDIDLISPYELMKENKTFFGPNWYEQEKDGRWMSNNASIFLFSGKERKISLMLEIASYYKERVIKLYLNKVLILSQIIPTYKVTITIPELKLVEGENLIEFKLSESCDIPYVTEKSEDKRCLSFKLFEFKIV